MKPEKLLLTIESITESSIGCCANNKSYQLCFNYYPTLKKLEFKDENQLAEVLRKFEFQLKKVIRSALKGKLTIGHQINCVFIEGFKFLNESDYNGFIHLDRRNSDLEISSSKEETEGLHKVFTDGSFAANTMMSGYGGFIQDTDGEREVFSQSFSGGSSNLMELLAVLDGLQRLQSVNEIQINTDSRFVIRGMVQWMHFWKYNDWQTAHGAKVKFADYWQLIDKLSEGKFIELNWIKGHSGHTEQDFCHNLAQKSASKSTDNIA